MKKYKQNEITFIKQSTVKRKNQISTFPYFNLELFS